MSMSPPPGRGRPVSSASSKPPSSRARHVGTPCCSRAEHAGAEREQRVSGARARGAPRPDPRRNPPRRSNRTWAGLAARRAGRARCSRPASGWQPARRACRRPSRVDHHVVVEEHDELAAPRRGRGSGRSRARHAARRGRARRPATGRAPSRVVGRSVVDDDQIDRGRRGGGDGSRGRQLAAHGAAVRADGDRDRRRRTAAAGAPASASAEWRRSGRRPAFSADQSVELAGPERGCRPASFRRRSRPGRPSPHHDGNAARSSGGTTSVDGSGRLRRAMEHVAASAASATGGVRSRDDWVRSAWGENHPTSGLAGSRLGELWRYRELVFPRAGATSRCATSRRSSASRGPSSSRCSAMVSLHARLRRLAHAPSDGLPVSAVRVRRCRLDALRVEHRPTPTTASSPTRRCHQGVLPAPARCAASRGPRRPRRPRRRSSCCSSC